MERDYRRDDRRRPDNRDHKPKYDRRSRSPPRRERDDHRRERSPFRSAPRGGGPPGRPDRDSRDFVRGRSPPVSRPGERRGPPRQPNGPPPRGRKQGPPSEAILQELDGEDEEAFMERVMGFRNFRTTKNTKVPGNDQNYAVHKVKKAEYRQYMNRVGGFNRPLSPSRT